MSKTITCYVRLKDGTPKKFKSKNGQNFKGPSNKTYEAPSADNYEILEIKGFLGEKKRIAFYVEGQAKAIPWSKTVKWEETASTDSDIDMLVRVTRAALQEQSLADLKQNLMLGGQALLCLIIIIQLIIN